MVFCDCIFRSLLSTENTKSGWQICSPVQQNAVKRRARKLRLSAEPRRASQADDFHGDGNITEAFIHHHITTLQSCARRNKAINKVAKKHGCRRARSRRCVASKSVFCTPL